MSCSSAKKTWYVYNYKVIQHDVSVLNFVAIQVLESYERAYTNMVRVQQLSELEEVCSLLFP